MLERRAAAQTKLPSHRWGSGKKQMRGKMDFNTASVGEAEALKALLRIARQELVDDRKSNSKKIAELLAKIKVSQAAGCEWES